MRATNNTRGLQWPRWLALLRSISSVFLLSVAISTGQLHAGEITNEMNRAERIYLTARGEYEAHPDKVEAAVNFARACFDRAELPVEDASRAKLGKEGMTAARHAVNLQPTNAFAHYYLGLNMGEVARIKKMSGLKLVAEMEEEFLAARNLNEKIDYAGPDRCLGMLYRDAPGWPMSVGNRNKARQHLLHTLDLAPEYPENWINMIETYLEWNDFTRASRDAVLLEGILPKAKSKFTGEEWEAGWTDWDARWDKIQKQLAEKSKAQKRR